MKVLREKQMELKTSLETVFSSIAANTADIKSAEQKYSKTISAFIHALEFLNYKTEIDYITKRIYEELETKKNLFTEIESSYSHLISNKNEICSVFENVETNFLLPSFYSVSEGQRKIKNLLQEITFLCQYDDILSQSFLSLEEILNIVEEIESGSFVVNKEQFLKLKVLFSSITVFIFDTLEDSLSLIESKMYRISSILKNSVSYLKTSLEIIDNQKNKIFEHFYHIRAFESVISGCEEKLESGLNIISALGDVSFIESFIKELSALSENLSVTNFNINILLNKKVFNTILEYTNSLFDSLTEKTDSTVEDFDFSSIFLSKFRIKEHKEMLMDIFGGTSEEVLDDNIEFF